MPTILIIEDEAKMRRLLELNLGEVGFKTLSAGDAETGLKLLASEPVHLVLTDLKLPGMTGLEFLQRAKQQNPALPIVVMTAFGSVETAVEAMKAGASDYVLKPFSLEEMRMVVRKELDHSALARRKPIVARGTGPEVQPSQHRRPQPQNAGGPGHRRARCAHQFHRASRRRKRGGKGFDCARDP